MLTGLSIKNVVLIEALNLEFNTGLSALTGETGAGKSIILDALGMATGARSDKALIRSGAQKAQCVASFELPLGHKIWERLAEADMEIEAGEDIILRRTLGRDGRSRAYINDAPVSVKFLSEIGALLLEVHGQYDGRGLMDVSTHLDLLDSFGGLLPLRAKCQEAFLLLKQAREEIESLTQRQEKAAQDRDFFEHAIGEIDRLDPQSGEDESLAAERRFLQGSEGALSELSAAEVMLGENGAFEDRLAGALAGIERVSSKFADLDGADMPGMKALKAAAKALERAMLETEDARKAVGEAAQHFQNEPGALDRIEKRLFSLRAAARKYDVPLESLIQKRADFALQLRAIETVGADLEAAIKRGKDLQDAYHKIADKLSASRLKAGKLLSGAVKTELPPLKMARAEFQVSISQDQPGLKGKDKVRFEVSTNPGSPIGPLDKIASGGEMARFALAIKVALAGKTKMVMVFDEVDQGVGGAVADAVGKRLARLASDNQVFVVTHSAQVAACAAHQFRIEKSSKGEVTTTDVKVIDDDEREEEIARMLAGETITNEARAAARKLMAS